MNDLETQMFREAYKYFAAHTTPPPLSDNEASAAWWRIAAEDICKVSAAWEDHPLIKRLLTAVCEYLEDKAKETMK